MQPARLILDTNFINLGGSANEINLMCSPADISNFMPSTESDIYEFSFKVKDGVAVDSTAKVALDEVHLSTCSELESEHDLEKQELTITVVENQEGEGDGEGESGDFAAERPSRPQKKERPQLEAVALDDDLPF